MGKGFQTEPETDRGTAIEKTEAEMWTARTGTDIEIDLVRKIDIWTGIEQTGIETGTVRGTDTATDQGIATLVGTGTVQ
jgi:hypothetical protein